MREVARGAKVFEAQPVTGVWRRLSDPLDVIELMDTSAEGVVAVVQDAGATFLSPIFEELAGVVCLSGTPRSHIGIVSRELGLPCVVGADLMEEVPDGSEVVVDCSGDAGIVRLVS